MRRGIGNPWRNKAPNPAIYAEALGKKFQAWRTQFSLEQGMDTIAQLPSIKEAEISKWLNEAIAAAADDPAKRTALETMLMQREFNKMEGAIDGTFYKRFLTWLMGKGQEEDHIRTPWYRQAQALELEEVRELLEAFLWEIHLVENQLLKLVWKGPQTLNEYYLYFKYVLQHQQFVLETDPWFFLEWRQYSKDNVVMDPHGKPAPYQGTIELAQKGREPPARGAGEAIEVMRDFFAQLQTVTQGEVENMRKAVAASEEQRLRDKEKAALMAGFSDDDEADVVQQLEEQAKWETKWAEAQTATLAVLRSLPEAIARAVKEAAPPAPAPAPPPPIAVSDELQAQLDRTEKMIKDMAKDLLGWTVQDLGIEPDLTESPPLSPSTSPPPEEPKLRKRPPGPSGRKPPTRPTPTTPNTNNTPNPLQTKDPDSGKWTSLRISDRKPTLATAELIKTIDKIMTFEARATVEETAKRRAELMNMTGAGLMEYWDENYTLG